MKLKVSRIVPRSLRNATNNPHVDDCVYSLEDCCKQGFLASMVDDDHYIVVSKHIIND